jgi:endonuclease VIII
VPEGDVVWNTAKRLHAALAGQPLTRSDFRVPRYATVSLTGHLVTEAVSRGKHLLIRTDNGLTVHTHLKMEGYWRIHPAAGPRPPGRSHQLRLVLGNAHWLAAGYLLGITEVLPTAQEDRVVGHLGPDLLGPDWDAAAAVERLARDPARPIGEALLDQRVLAGAGTIFATEMMFLRGINPWRPAGSIPGDDLLGLAELGHRLLDANKERPGHITTGDARPGRENWAYGRAGRPCRRCGTVIRRGEQGPPGQERLRFWCPSCQRGLPAAVYAPRLGARCRKAPAGSAHQVKGLDRGRP